jgi:hypothetical protein
MTCRVRSCRDKEGESNEVDMMGATRDQRVKLLGGSLSDAPSFIWSLTIMCMNAIPPRMMRAQRKFLKPSMGRVRRWHGGALSGWLRGSGRMW